ncbi:unnamed protein product [Rotaria socialis]
MENILTAFTKKIEYRLQQLEERLINQVTMIEKKVDNLKFTTSILETVIYETILPVIKVVHKCSFNNTRNTSALDELTKYSNDITYLLTKRDNNQLSKENANPSGSRVTQSSFNKSGQTTPMQQNDSLSTLSEWYSNTNKKEVVEKWLQERRKPDLGTTNMTILHYNIRYFHPNQCDLLDMISQHNPTVISLNKLGTIVSDKTIKQLLFSYNIFTSKGTNSHGGAVLAADKKLNAAPLNIHQLNCVAVQVIVKNQTYVLASIYSPPNEPVPLKTMSSLNRISKNVIIVGDLNVKHPNWGCTSMHHKGRLLVEWLENSDKYAIQNHGMKISLRSDTTIDLVLTTPTISLSHCGTLSYTGSDHLPILMELNGISLQDNNYTISKTYW